MLHGVDEAADDDDDDDGIPVSIYFLFPEMTIYTLLLRLFLFFYPFLILSFILCLL